MANSKAEEKVWSSIAYLILAAIFPINVLLFLLRFIVAKMRKKVIILKIREVDPEEVPSDRNILSDGIPIKTKRWVVLDSEGKLPGQLIVRMGYKIVWTLDPSQHSDIKAELAFPSILFKRAKSEDETRKAKWFGDRHVELVPDRPIERTVSSCAPPGDYPYSVEIFKKNEQGEFVEEDRFVVGGSHTRTHHPPW